MGSDAGSTGLVGKFIDLSVKTKVFGGFGVILVLLAIVGGVGYFSSNEASSQIEEYRQITDTGYLIDDSQALLIEMRRYSRELELTGDPAIAQKAREAAATFEKKLSSAIATIKDQSTHAAFLSIAEMFKSYDAQLQDLIVLQAKYQTALKGDVDKRAAEVQQAFSGLSDEAAKALRQEVVKLADQATIASLGSSVSLYQYLLAGEEMHLDTVQRRMAEVESALKTLSAMVRGSALSDEYARTQSAVEAYVTAKTAALALRGQLDDLVENKMPAVSDGMRQELDAINDSSEKLLAKIDADTTSLLSYVSLVTLTLSCGALAIGAALAWFIGRSIASGILDITSAMRELAGGNKAIEVPHRNRRDEVGAMGTALQVFKDTAIEADRMAAEQKAEQEKRVKRGEFLAKLVADFNDAIKAVVEGVGSGASQMRSSAQALSAIAEETNNQSTTVAAAAEEASRSVQTVASAAEELNASIAEINRQIDGSARLANGAVDQVRATNQTVETLSSAAKEIGNVVQLIQDIAAQTNLLALNATIEAARAGEAGKGFAVVASEVKSLANQTAKATEDISAQIGQIQNVANQSVAAMAEVGKSVGQISEASSTVAAAAQEQAAATAEISRSVQQVSVGTSEVASNIVHVTKAAGETGQMSGQVLNASNELSKQAENLRKVVTQFIAQVQAA